jgi:serine/threonine protein kinase
LLRCISYIFIHRCQHTAPPIIDSIVHGDVKPENLLLGQPGSGHEKKLFLTDFCSGMLLHKIVSYVDEDIQSYVLNALCPLLIGIGYFRILMHLCLANFFLHGSFNIKIMQHPTGNGKEDHPVCMFSMIRGQTYLGLFFLLFVYKIIVPI